MNRERTIIGREGELSRLRDIFASVRAGHGGILLLAGEAGIGKTRLAEETLTESGLTVLTGRTREEATLGKLKAVAATAERLTNSLRVIDMGRTPSLSRGTCGG